MPRTVEPDAAGLAPSRPPSWKWVIAGLLLLATTINYLDRQTLSTLSKRIIADFHLDKEQYGDLEMAFGLAFAAGSLVFGLLADAVNIRWLYPAVLLAWSLVGVLTGFTESFDELLLCRSALGFFEAGHWPCAVLTMQRLLLEKDRTLGNSVLQSGAAIGAILTPLAVNFMVGDSTEPGVWRSPFIVVGSAGTLWIIGWFCLIRSRDLSTIPPDAFAVESFWAAIFSRRFLALLVVVVALNTTWQLLRAWMLLFLVEGRQYSETDARYFNSAFFVAADIGCLLAGATVGWLTRRGWAGHRARVLVFGCCAALTTLTTAAAYLPKGPALLGVLLVVAAGSLGLFPCYYSFTQDLGRQHVGKISGLLASLGWLISAPTHKWFGREIDATHSYDLGIAWLGWMPLVGFVTLLILWRSGSKTHPLA